MLDEVSSGTSVAQWPSEHATSPSTLDIGSPSPRCCVRCGPSVRLAHRVWRRRAMTNRRRVAMPASGAAFAARESATDQSASRIPPRPSSVPPPVGLTGQLANWLQIRGEFRGRFEGFTSGSYTPENHDGYMLDRFRISATIAPSEVAKFVVQVQDARTFDKTTGGGSCRFRDTLDLRLAYGEFGGTRNMIRVGRQELVFGEQRLIGRFDGPTPHAALTPSARRSVVSRSSSMPSPRRWSAFSRKNSTRAATATCCMGSTVHQPQQSRDQPWSPTSSGGCRKA